METYQIEGLSFCYPQMQKPVLKNISFSVPQGQFLTLCGPSGCGKSTLLRQLKTVLTPHGATEGTVLFEGRPLQECGQRTQASKIGFVLQSPDNQIVTDKVWHELAFGLESLGVKTPEIRLRVAEMASFFGIQNWFYRSVSELSGGQKQLLNLASVMAMQPSVLLLDEPTSQLDPIAAADFLETVQKINRELGVTVLITEHRLEEVLPMSDRVLVLDNGEIIADGAPQEVGAHLEKGRHKMFLAMPAAMRIHAGVKTSLPCPVTVREGRSWLNAFSEKQKLREINQDKADTPDTKQTPAIEIKEAYFRYEKNAPDVIKALSMQVYPGEFYAIVGGNGTGKSTALSLISGIHMPYRGKVEIGGRELSKISDKQLFNRLLGVLPQNPQALFVKKTVEADLLEMLSESSFSSEKKKEKLLGVAKLCALEPLLQKHPYDLSGGEQQRAALAKVLLLEPKILLLDEPTKGMDNYFKRTFAALLQKLQAQGVTILMVSHDIEFCAEYADRCAMFFDGSIVTEGSPHDFFSGNSFYTTAANRIARGKISNAVTVADVIYACGGNTEIFSIPPPPPKPPVDVNTYFQEANPQKREMITPNRKLSKRTLLASIIILLTIPLTIFFGMYYLGDRKYYFISLLVILEIMLPFAMIFESRKPQARELIIIAVLCAIGVAGRAAFYMVPQFKPVIAIVIIAGVCFGGETGFLVGAVTGFVSNMFMGQGPWTPWQMFSFGIIGFLAGLLYQKGLLSKGRLSLSVFGAFATFFVYGGLMNLSSLLTNQPHPTLAMIWLYYLKGIPFDLLHAAATFIFLWIISKPMIEKLYRIKQKYGLMEA